MKIARDPNVREALKWLRAGADPNRLPHGVKDPFINWNPRPGVDVVRYTSREILWTIQEFGGPDYKYIRNVNMKAYKWSGYSQKDRFGHRKFWKYEGDRQRVRDVEMRLPEPGKVWPIELLRDNKELLANEKLQELFQKLYNNFLSIAELPQITDTGQGPSTGFNAYYFGMVELLHMLMNAPQTIKRLKEDPNYHDIIKK